jgi:hypothetical protein
MMLLFSLPQAYLLFAAFKFLLHMAKTSRRISLPPKVCESCLQDNKKHVALCVP